MDKFSYLESLTKPQLKVKKKIVEGILKAPISTQQREYFRELLDSLEFLLNPFEKWEE